MSDRKTTTTLNGSVKGQLVRLGEIPMPSTTTISASSAGKTPPAKPPTTVGLKLQLPKPIDPALLAQPGGIDEIVNQKMAAAKDIQSGIADALAWQQEVTCWLATLQSTTEDTDEAKRDKKLRYRLSKVEVERGQVEVGNYITACFELDDPIYRSVATIGYLNFKFGLEFASQKEAEAMLKDLEERRLLVRANNGPIQIGYAKFAVPETLGLEADDIDEIQIAVAKFTRAYLVATAQQRQATTVKISHEVTLTFEQLMEGIEGKFLLDVPAESYLDAGGNEKWRGGGNLLIEVCGTDIIPLQGVGSIERIVVQMVDMDVRIGHFTLGWDAPPGSGRAFDRIVDEMMRTSDITLQNAEIYVKKLQLFWHLLQRGIRARNRKVEMDDLRSLLKEGTKLDPEEFFGINGEPKLGTVFLNYGGVFSHQGKMIYDIFFVIERSQDEDETNFLKVIDAPEHVKAMFKGLFGVPLQEGQDFEMIAPLLQRILRSIKAITGLAVELAKA